MENLTVRSDQTVQKLMSRLKQRIVLQLAQNTSQGTCQVDLL